MLHAITLKYLVPAPALQPYLDGHKHWLVENMQRGAILFAGPLDDGNGGFLLVKENDKHTLDALLAADPFISEGLVESLVQSMTPALCSDALAPSWAGDGKIIASLGDKI